MSKLYRAEDGTVSNNSGDMPTGVPFHRLEVEALGEVFIEKRPYIIYQEWQVDPWTDKRTGKFSLSWGRKSNA
jgi:hypothetical protein